MIYTPESKIAIRISHIPIRNYLGDGSVSNPLLLARGGDMSDTTSRGRWSVYSSLRTLSNVKESRTPFLWSVAASADMPMITAKKMQRTMPPVLNTRLRSRTPASSVRPLQSLPTKKESYRNYKAAVMPMLSDALKECVTSIPS